MAITNLASFAQYRRASVVSATTANSTYIGSATTIANSVLLHTVGPDGGILTKLSALMTATVTVTQLQVFISRDGGGSLFFWNSVLMASSGYTMAQTTLPPIANFLQPDGTTLSEADGYPLSGVTTFGVAPVYGGLSGGTANAQTLTFAAISSNPNPGTIVYFEAGVTNTGSTTITPGAQAAQTILRDQGGAALSAGDILKGMRYGMRWDGANWRLFITDRIYVAIGVTLANGIIFNAQVAEF